MTSITEAVLRLSIDQVTKLQSQITEAGLRKELGNNSHRQYFKNLRRKSKGKLRICYAALCQASDAEFDRVCEILVKDLRH